MRSAAIVLVLAIAAPAFAQRAPGEETRPTAPPSVRLEQKPETFDGFRMMACPRIPPSEQQSDQPSDKQADKTTGRPDGCRLVPPKREHHPDYGKGKLYDLTPA